MEQSWKVVGKGKDGFIKICNFVVTFSDGSFTSQQAGSVPIEIDLPSSSSEEEIIEAVKAQLGVGSIAQLEREAVEQKKYADAPQDEVIFESSSLTLDERKGLDGITDNCIVMRHAFISTLKTKGWYDAIVTAVNSADEQAKIYWEHTPAFNCKDTTLLALFTSAGLTDDNKEDAIHTAQKLTF